MMSKEVLEALVNERVKVIRLEARVEELERLMGVLESSCPDKYHVDGSPVGTAQNYIVSLESMVAELNAELGAWKDALQHATVPNP